MKIRDKLFRKNRKETEIETAGETDEKEKQVMPPYGIPPYSVTFNAGMIIIELRVPPFGMKDSKGNRIEPIGALLAEARNLYLFAKNPSIQKKFEMLLLKQIDIELSKQN